MMPQRSANSNTIATSAVNAGILFFLFNDLMDFPLSKKSTASVNHPCMAKLNLHGNSALPGLS